MDDSQLKNIKDDLDRMDKIYDIQIQSYLIKTYISWLINEGVGVFGIQHKLLEYKP